MSLFPSAPDIFVDRTGSDVIASSDPNNAYDAIEKIENFLGASGEAQSKSVTMVNLFRAMLQPLPALSYINASSIGIPATQIALFNGDNFVFKRNSAATTCSLALHLLNGSEAATTWYEVYIVGDGSNSEFTIGLLGQGTSPSAYATYYQKIGAIRNDGSSDILKFYQQNNKITYDNIIDVLVAGTSAAFADIDLSYAVPAPCDAALCGYVSTLSGGGLVTLDFRTNGSAAGTGSYRAAVGRKSSDNHDCSIGEFSIYTGSDGIIEYKVADGIVNLYVKGYYLNI